MMSRGRREIGHIYIRCIEHKGYKMKDFLLIYILRLHTIHTRRCGISLAVAIKAIPALSALQS